MKFAWQTGRLSSNNARHVRKVRLQNSGWLKWKWHFGQTVLLLAAPGTRCCNQKESDSGVAWTGETAAHRILCWDSCERGASFGRISGYRDQDQEVHNRDTNRCIGCACGQDCKGGGTCSMKLTESQGSSWSADTRTFERVSQGLLRSSKVTIIWIRLKRTPCSCFVESAVIGSRLFFGKGMGSCFSTSDGNAEHYPGQGLRTKLLRFPSMNFVFCFRGWIQSNRKYGMYTRKQHSNHCAKQRIFTIFSGAEKRCLYSLQSFCRKGL